MKYNKFIFIAMLFLTQYLLVSCKKSFLDIPPKNEVTRQEYVKDLTTTQHFLNGIYLIFSKDFYHGYHQIYSEIIADNIKIKTGQTFLSAHHSWIQKPNNDGSAFPSRQSVNMNSYWIMGYQMIGSCSFAAAKAEEYMQENTSTAKEIRAQALALRAFIHFNLVNVFAQSYNYTADASHVGIPYVKTWDWTQTPLKRLTVGEVYQSIEEDLNAAISNYDNSSSINTLALNRAAAKAFLARVLLFKGDYQKSKNLAAEISAMVPIMKGSNYPSKLFTPQETEALFQLKPSSTASAVGNTYSTNFQGRYFQGTASQVQFLATMDFANLVLTKPTDVRNKWIGHNSTGVDTIKKFPVNIIAGFSPTTSAYYPTLIRSSEMYLTAAEAYSNLNMEDSARFYLDEIRLRANPTAVPSTATGTALLDSIRLERRIELAFEGLRMFDLLRWKKDVDRLDAPSPSAKNLPYPSNLAIAPIPLNDVKIGGMPQNEGY